MPGRAHGPAIGEWLPRAGVSERDSEGEDAERQETYPGGVNQPMFVWPPKVRFSGHPPLPAVLHFSTLNRASFARIRGRVRRR